MDNLVYDRTQADGSRIKSYITKGYSSLTEDELAEWQSLVSKGAWNYTDANRVGEWVNFLCNLLTYAGVDTSSIPAAPTNYDISSSLWNEDVQQLQDSIQALRDLYINNPTLENMVPGPSWNYAQANALEKNLQILYDAVSLWFVIPSCGDALCGGDYT